MRVFQFPGEVTTNPKRETFGITFAARGGDVLHPYEGSLAVQFSGRLKIGD
jgi:hypothetical protein